MSIAEFSDAGQAEPSAAGTPAEPSLVCPTCGARQVPADTCRRCQSDLRMVLAVREQHDELRRRCLALLATRRLKRATALAQQSLELSCDDGSARLLATSYLLQGNFPAALLVYAQFGPHGR